MKRRIYFLYIIWVQVVAISLSSCDDELTDINRNPNATENPQPAYLLAAAQYHAANLFFPVWRIRITVNKDIAVKDRVLCC